VQDTRLLIEMMQRVSDEHHPKLWNVGTIAFDTYLVTYDSRRAGDAVPMSFYPIKGTMTIYPIDRCIPPSNNGSPEISQSRKRAANRLLCNAAISLLQSATLQNPSTAIVDNPVSIWIKEDR
jgi:hypothetical protein